MRYFLTQFDCEEAKHVVLTHHSETKPTLRATLDWLESQGLKDISNVRVHEFINKQCFDAYRDGIPYAKEWFKY